MSRAKVYQNKNVYAENEANREKTPRGHRHPVSLFEHLDTSIPEGTLWGSVSYMNSFCLGRVESDFLIICQIASALWIHYNFIRIFKNVKFHTYRALAVRTEISWPPVSPVTWKNHRGVTSRQSYGSKQWGGTRSPVQQGLLDPQCGDAMVKKLKDALVWYPGKAVTYGNKLN